MFDLKTCPFCGSHVFMNRETKISLNEPRIDCYSVKCQNINCRAQIYFNGSLDSLLGTIIHFNERKDSAE